MRALELEELKEGMRIARTLYDDTGRELLNSGTVLTKSYISKLGMFGIPFVYIEDELLGPIEVKDLIHDRVRLQTVKALKDVINNARINSELDLRHLSGMVNKILDDMKGVTDLLVQLLDMRSSAMYIYNHSVSVCVLSVATGMALALNDLKIKALGMGAILHDLGKSVTGGPEHTIHGFELLRNNKAISAMVSHVAYQHHEHYDGSGYPRQIKGEDIHLFAAIAGVANYYDNLVSNPDREQRLLPYQAVELLTAQSGKAFHPQIVKAFTRNIAPYPVGSAVRLNDGAVGVIVAVNRNMPTRPLVKLITNRKGMMLRNFPEIDLLEDNTLFIDEILSEKERQEIIIA